MNAEQFARGAAPRRGLANPSRFDEPSWEWMVRNGGDAYGAREHFGLQGAVEPPTWCFERFGMSCTALDDGRLLCIGGEHEDSYDPDFYIYNDVVVLAPAAGRQVVDVKTAAIEILGYPAAVLPPTDFHTATRVGERIYLVGRLGYDEPSGGQTPVFALDTSTFGVEPFATRGPGPRWLHGHAAGYDPASHSIVVGSGKVKRWGKLRPNRATWRLHLEDGRWERCRRTTMRRRFDLVTADRHGMRHVEDCLRLRDPSARRLVSTPTRVVDYHRAEARGALLECKDWGCSYDLTIDGLVDEEAAAALLADLLHGLAEQSGGPWTARPLREHAG